MSEFSDRLKDIEARANAATQGPWKVAGWNKRTIIPAEWADDIGSPSERQKFTAFHATNETDAEFIAAARTEVPWLIEELRKAHEAIEALEENARHPYGY
jgi:hypothetical protein